MTLTAEVTFIDQIQNFEEMIGMKSQRLNSNTRIRRATEEALEKCNLLTQFITDIQCSCGSMWEIHISGTVNKEKRQELVECISKKMNCNKECIKIIAFYN